MDSKHQAHSTIEVRTHLAPVALKPSFRAVDIAVFAEYFWLSMNDPRVRADDGLRGC